MALSEAEELELLQLEEDEALAGGQTPQESNPPADLTPPESKTRKFIRGVANALPTVGGIGVPAVAAIGSGGLSLPATAGLAGVGAAGGTAAKQLILRALGDTEGVPNTPLEAAKDIGVTGATDAVLTYTGGKFLKGAGKALKLGKDLITKPGAAEVAQLGKEALVKVGERGAEKLALARATKEAAKKGLIAAEEKAGLHFASTPGFEDMLRDPKKMAEFTQKIGRLSARTPEELAQSVPSEQLQLFRKIAQEGEKVSSLSDIAKSEMRRGKDIFTQALGMKEKGIGEALGKFRDADKVVGEIPGEIKSRLLKTKMLNEKELFDAKSLDKKRRVVKGLAKAAAYGLGAKAILK
jgi:hypothetical protein